MTYEVSQGQLMLEVHLQGCVAAAQVVQPPHIDELLLRTAQDTRLDITQVELKVNCRAGAHGRRE